MITDAGSREQRSDEINKALYPLAGTFGNLVDKDMTTLTELYKYATYDALGTRALILRDRDKTTAPASATG